MLDQVTRSQPVMLRSSSSVSSSLPSSSSSVLFMRVMLWASRYVSDRSPYSGHFGTYLIKCICMKLNWSDFTIGFTCTAWLYPVRRRGRKIPVMATWSPGWARRVFSPRAYTVMLLGILPTGTWSLCRISDGTKSLFRDTLTRPIMDQSPLS